MTSGTDLAKAREVLSGGIRPLTLQDLPEVLDIERQGYARPWTQGVFLDCFRSGYVALGIEQSDRLGGYGILALMYDEAHLLNLCIRPACRGRGLARTLVRELVAQAEQSAMARIILEVRVSNQSARRLYESEGFELIGERHGYYPDVRGRENALVMALGLSAPADPTA
ncbi:[SSU ribosomal protein S18P]-alanine acetyltransferase [Marinobacter daqiaonensis]|uniref:[Ribosomal protein bS18]-alanine N-acetyltransferase n=1 Tax=Marinobacter daqiaonensis TaxID=650891 RepID=A0A1I6J2D7_9GAMM|nr:ribosomal protein S18-alanine N-acetyltransferase [Marinobacter daqiaonensis]SFR73089.1 [SSU ribosomal protein S18P]-alanine acetyltransferase [Marinobacter daqiaonensis]